MMPRPTMDQQISIWAGRCANALFATIAVGCFIALVVMIVVAGDYYIDLLFQ